jgi:hypothetical protein
VSIVPLSPLARPRLWRAIVTIVVIIAEVVDEVLKRRSGNK